MSTDQSIAAGELHKSAFVFDALMPWGNLDNLDSMWDAAAGGVNAAHVTVAHFPHSYTETIGRIGHYRRIVEENPSSLALVRSVAELHDAANSGRVGVVFGFQDSAPIGYRLELVQLYAQLGVRIIQLTYNDQNPVGSGCCEAWQGPLSRFGKRLLRELERNRIAVDVAHCGDETTEDALRVAEAPVLCTHSGAREVCDAYGRNKTDLQIREIARTGGVIGVPLAPFLIKRAAKTHHVLPSTVRDVVRHIQYIAELVGWEHVGIGTDLCSAWLEQRTTPPESSLRWWRQTCPHVFGIGPSEEYEPYPSGLRKHSELVNITSELKKMGWPDESIRGVLGENFLRALKVIWGE